MPGYFRAPFRLEPVATQLDPKLRQLGAQIDRNFDEIEYPAGGIPTLFVAAADATERSKEIADYVCTGTGDQGQINAAMAALDGADPFTGRVLLSEGNFYLTSNVQLGWRTMLQGFGYATTLNLSGGITGIATDEETVVRDLHVYGDNASGSIGIYSSGVRSQVENCSVERCQTGINVATGNGPTHVLNCRVGSTSAPTPFSIDLGSGGTGSAVDALIQGCVLARSLRVVANYALIVNNRFSTSANIDVVSGNGNCFQGNFLPFGLSSFTDAGTQTQRGTNFSQSVTW